MSKDTADIKEEVKTVKTTNLDMITKLQDKAQDLEDRSRRNNLVFFGFPEAGDNSEHCEALVTNVLKNTSIINRECGQMFDRAHRLGKKKADGNRPRPIIVRVTFYKDKEHILKSAHKLKGTSFAVSEDFSKLTLSARNQLVMKAKQAINVCSAMKSFKLNYKTLVVKYENPETESVFFRGFSLLDVTDNPRWYIPKARQHVSSNSR